MTGGVVVLLRDSCSAVAILLELRKQGNDKETCNRIADCMLLSLAAEATLHLTDVAAAAEISEARYNHHLQQHNKLHVVCVGVTTSSGHLCFSALPPIGRFFLDFSLSWARYAQHEQMRQYIARCKMAMLQTVGGGWASLRRADKALQCAIMLYKTAAMVNDVETVRKCRVFVGWAHLWNGDSQRAVEILERLRKQALLEGDVMQERRCSSALLHARHNALQCHGELPLSGCWTEVFAIN